MCKVHLIGVDGGPVSREAMEAFERCGVVVSAERLRRLFDCRGKKVRSITPLDKALDMLEAMPEGSEAAVLASGDPFFFGIGRRLLTCLGPERLTVYPALSAMQLAAARFKIPWDDADFVSLHGRGDRRDYAGLLGYAKVFVLTDKANSPDAVAVRLLNELGGISDDALSSWTVWVGENLGMQEERITRGGLAEIAGQTFDPLNIMLLVRESGGASSPLAFGLREEEIQHSRGLITKNEIRAATLHALRLPARGVLWDVGAGSGSIAIEAARLCPGLQVFAVERSPEQSAHIRANRHRFGAYNMEVVVGEAPEALGALPAPDRIFVGGSGGRLEEILKVCAARLAGGGRIVVNGVTAETKTRAPKLLHEAGLMVRISEIVVVRHDYTPGGTAKETLNPISIMVGCT